MPEDDERGLYPKTDPAARAALRAYAMATPNLRLETDLIVWLQRFEDENGRFY